MPSSIARFHEDTDSIKIMDHKTKYAHKYVVTYIQKQFQFHSKFILYSMSVFHIWG